MRLATDDRSGHKGLQLADYGHGSKREDMEGKEYLCQQWTLKMGEYEVSVRVEFKWYCLYCMLLCCDCGKWSLHSSVNGRASCVCVCVSVCVCWKGRVWL